MALIHPPTFAEIAAYAVPALGMFARRPRMNRRGVGAQNLSPFAPIIPQITQASGCQLWFDSDFSGGAADGAGVTAATNRSGSNAVFNAIGASCTYQAKGWGGQQSCWYFDSNTGNNAAFWSGTDIANAGNGIGKLWTILLVVEPVLNTIGTNYFAGLDKSNGALFANGLLMRCKSNDYHLYGIGVPGTDSTADAAVFELGPLMVEFQRSATQIAFGINTVVGTPITYMSGTNVSIDGLSLGCWRSGSGNTVQSNMRIRAGGFWDHNFSAGERTTMRDYVAQWYYGFDTYTSMGIAA